MEADERLLLIGQAPSRTGDPAAVLIGRSGIWLADLMGISLSEYVRRTDRVNLFDRWPGKNGKGDAWDIGEAGRRAVRLMPMLEGRQTIFLGRNAAAAFGMPKVPWMTWIVAFGGGVAVIPHPSGIVSWWNDAGNRAAASEFLRGAVGGLC